MGNLVLQIEKTTDGSVGPDSPVLFNQTVFLEGNVTYDEITGTVTFLEGGSYLVNWWAAIQAVAADTSVIFEVVTSQGDQLKGNLPGKTGTVTGIGVIEVLTPPVTMTVRNGATGNAFFSASVPVKSTLLVFSHGGETGIRGDSECFAVDQLGHVVQQLIDYYPTSVMSVFTTNVNTITGTPVQLFGESIFILDNGNNQNEAIPLVSICAIYAGAGTVYNQDITYLEPPDPLPQGCFMSLLDAMVNYLPDMTSVLIQMGVTIQATGEIYRNEYGVLVLSDADGNTPVFVAVPKIARLVTNQVPEFNRGGQGGQVEIIQGNL